jgi:hypothetical protein
VVQALRERQDGWAKQGSEPPRTDRATLAAQRAAMGQKWAMGSMECRWAHLQTILANCPRKPASLGDPASLITPSGPPDAVPLAGVLALYRYPPLPSLRLACCERVLRSPRAFLVLAAGRICTRPDQEVLSDAAGARRSRTVLRSIFKFVQ